MLTGNDLRLVGLLQLVPLVGRVVADPAELPFCGGDLVPGLLPHRLSRALCPAPRLPELVA